MATWWDQTRFGIRSPYHTISAIITDIQAKRRRSKRKNDIELVYSYAGQIFCEMLGQTCYQEFYKNPKTTYQEVSPPPPNSAPVHMLTYIGLRYPWLSRFNNNILRQTPKHISVRPRHPWTQLPQIFDIETTHHAPSHKKVPYVLYS